MHQQLSQDILQRTTSTCGGLNNNVLGKELLQKGWKTTLLYKNSLNIRMMTKRNTMHYTAKYLQRCTVNYNKITRIIENKLQA